MTIEEAARVIEEVGPELRRLRDQYEAAQEAAKRHFRETGETTYEGRLGYERTTQTRVDLDRVKVHLAHCIKDFQYTIDVERVVLLGARRR